MASRVYDTFIVQCRNPCFDAVWWRARAGTQVNVTQEHNNPSRNDVYIDSAFTP